MTLNINSSTMVQKSSRSTLATYVRYGHPGTNIAVTDWNTAVEKTISLIVEWTHALKCVWKQIDSDDKNNQNPVTLEEICKLLKFVSDDLTKVNGVYTFESKNMHDDEQSTLIISEDKIDISLNNDGVDQEWYSFTIMDDIDQKDESTEQWLQP